MQLNSLFKWAVCLTLFSTLLSCQDHLAPTRPANARLKYWESVDGRTRIRFNYKYNTQGRLDSIISYINSSIAQPTALTYDRQNRLTRAIQGYSSDYYQYNYEYDPSGKLKTVKGYFKRLNSDSLELRSTTTFDYNEVGQIGKSTLQYPNTSSSTVTNYRYERGNVVETVISFPGTTSVDNITTFQFDDKPNPLYGLLGSEVPGVPVQHYLLINRNNIVNQNKTLTYNNDGLLTSSVENILGGIISNTYQYESY